MDEAFLLKKILALFVQPVGLVLFLLILTFIAIPTRKAIVKREDLRKEKSDTEGSAAEEDSEETVRYKPAGGFASFLLAGAIFLLYGFSIKPVSQFLVGTIEKNVPWESLIPADFVPSHIVVLPAGARDGDLPSTSRLSYGTLSRMRSGIQYWEQFPEAILVFSGTEEETSGMKEEAIRSGVPERQIFVENEARDTKGHAVHLSGLLENKPFLLVTSAIHLPRSMALFQGEGLQPLGVPVDFTVDTRGGADLEIRDFIPAAKFLMQSEHALHEIVGLVWAQVRGQTG